MNLKKKKILLGILGSTLGIGTIATVGAVANYYSKSWTQISFYAKDSKGNNIFLFQRKYRAGITFEEIKNSQVIENNNTINNLMKENQIIDFDNAKNKNNIKLNNSYSFKNKEDIFISFKDVEKNTVNLTLKIDLENMSDDEKDEIKNNLKTILENKLNPLIAFNTKKDITFETKTNFLYCKLNNIQIWEYNNNDFISKDKNKLKIDFIKFLNYLNVGREIEINDNLFIATKKLNEKLFNNNFVFVENNENIEISFTLKPKIELIFDDKSASKTSIILKKYEDLEDLLNAYKNNKINFYFKNENDNTAKNLIYFLDPNDLSSGYKEIIDSSFGNYFKNNKNIKLYSFKNWKEFKINIDSDLYTIKIEDNKLSGDLDKIKGKKYEIDENKIINLQNEDEIKNYLISKNRIIKLSNLINFNDYTVKITSSGNSFEFKINQYFNQKQLKFETNINSLLTEDFLNYIYDYSFGKFDEIKRKFSISIDEASKKISVVEIKQYGIQVGSETFFIEQANKDLWTAIRDNKDNLKGLSFDFNNLQENFRIYDYKCENKIHKFTNPKEIIIKTLNIFDSSDKTYNENIKVPFFKNIQEKEFFEKTNSNNKNFINNKWTNLLAKSKKLFGDDEKEFLFIFSNIKNYEKYFKTETLDINKITFNTNISINNLKMNNINWKVDGNSKTIDDFDNWLTNNEFLKIYNDPWRIKREIKNDAKLELEKKLINTIFNNKELNSYRTIHDFLNTKKNEQISNEEMDKFLTEKQWKEITISTNNVGDLKIDNSYDNIDDFVKEAIKQMFWKEKTLYFLNENKKIEHITYENLFKYLKSSLENKLTDTESTVKWNEIKNEKKLFNVFDIKSIKAKFANKEDASLLFWNVKLNSGTFEFEDKTNESINSWIDSKSNFNNKTIIYKSKDWSDQVVKKLKKFNNDITYDLIGNVEFKIDYYSSLKLAFQNDDLTLLNKFDFSIDLENKTLDFNDLNNSNYLDLIDLTTISQNNLSASTYGTLKNKSIEILDKDLGNTEKRYKRLTLDNQKRIYYVKTFVLKNDGQKNNFIYCSSLYGEDTSKQDKETINRELNNIFLDVAFNYWKENSYDKKQETIVEERSNNYYIDLSDYIVAQKYEEKLKSKLNDKFKDGTKIYTKRKYYVYKYSAWDVRNVFQVDNHHKDENNEFLNNSDINIFSRLDLYNHIFYYNKNGNTVDHLSQLIDNDNTMKNFLWEMINYLENPKLNEVTLTLDVKVSKSGNVSYQGSTASFINKVRDILISENSKKDFGFNNIYYAKTWDK